MKITYLGTAAAEGVPAMFCNCPTCKEARRLGGKELRTRTQMIIDDTLGIDFPPDAYAHAVQFNVDLSAIEHLLVTHSHMDHFYAHDFILRGYKYASEMTAPILHIYGNEEVGKVFLECTRREIREDVKESLPMSVLKPFLPQKIGGYTVTALPAVHSKVERAYLYLIERGERSYLHLHDSGLPEASVFSYLKDRGVKLGLVSLDCTFIDTHSSTSGRHMGLDENKAVKERLLLDGVADENTKFVITHFSHNSAPLTARLKPIEKEYGVIAAYDGMSIEIE